MYLISCVIPSPCYYRWHCNALQMYCFSATDVTLICLPVHWSHPCIEQKTNTDLQQRSNATSMGGGGGETKDRQTVRHVLKSFLSRKSHEYYIFVCARACVRARMLCICPGVYTRVRACSLVYPACSSYAPYCDVKSGPSVSATFFDIIS
jgi:hypothetical protein